MNDTKRKELEIKIYEAFKRSLLTMPADQVITLRFRLRMVFCEVYGAVPNIWYFESQLISNDVPEGRELVNAHGKIKSIADYGDRQIDYPATLANIMKKYPDAIYIRDSSDAFMFTERFILQLPDCVFLSLDYDIPKEIYDILVFQTPKPKVYYVTYDRNGFNTRPMDIKLQDCNIADNYNDDIPHEKILNTLKSEDSGIIILHGVPGCGKTSYIRQLIKDNPGTSFLFLDSSTFSHITDASFINLLISNKNAIIIVEDCEDLLVSRDTRGNYQISSLLNLSDGILGDSLNLKFICTFNADINDIDKALLRKGRLKVKYEFGKLTKDKAIKLAEKLGKDTNISEAMSLCDVYTSENNGGESIVKPRPRIGFK